MKEQNVKDIHMMEAIITTSAVTNMIGSIPETLHTIIAGGTATPGIIQRTHIRTTITATPGIIQRTHTRITITATPGIIQHTDTAGNPNYYGTGLPEQPPAFLFGLFLGWRWHISEFI